MKKFFIIIFAIFSIGILSSCKTSSKDSVKTNTNPQQAIQGEWISYSESKINLPKTTSAADAHKLLDLTASTSEKIKFDKKKVTLATNEYDYKLGRQIIIGSYSYDYKLEHGQDILKFDTTSSDIGGNVYYRVGSKLEKEKTKEINDKEAKEKKSVTHLNEVWKAKTDIIEKSLKVAMIGTWSGHFKAVATTGQGVAWAPGMQTLTFDGGTNLSFHASSDSLTNFDQKVIHNAYASYQPNGILGLEPSDHIPVDPKKLLNIIKDLTAEQMFSRIKYIAFSYDVTTDTGTISQSFSPSELSYKNGKLSFDTALLITQCGDEGVQISGDVSKTE